MSGSELRKVYDNRELSWLKFNKRVLEEACDENAPLLERLRFASIFCSNLDEFFMVRAGVLTERAADNDCRTDGKTGMKPSEQLEQIFSDTRKLMPDFEKAYSEIERLLAVGAAVHTAPEEADKEESVFLDNYFDSVLLKQLSPQIFPSGSERNIFENKEIYLVCKLSDRNENFSAIVKCPKKRIIITPHKETPVFCLAEELMLSRAEKIFPDYLVCEKALVRITRSSAIDFDERIKPDEDYRTAMQTLLFEQKDLPPVRAQLYGEVSQVFKCGLLYTLGISENRLFFQKTPLDLGFCDEINDFLHDRSDLFFPPFSPEIPEHISENVPIHVQAERCDILLTYPYEDFGIFLRLLDEAACDETAAEICITLYRTADDSRVIKSLCKAAQNGKRVNVYIELRARFDERHNSDCSYRLEKSGCRVAYGLSGYKVHSKLCLIKRRNESGESFTVQVGTGNYNESTAKQYADFSFITSDKEIAEGAEEFFEKLMRLEIPDVLNGRLIFSPTSLKKTILALIDREILTAESGLSGYIGIKCNGLTDKDIMDALIEASAAGVKIDLIIRGICCLIPDVKGLTDNIRIISIVGRYLEHSRIYIFGKGEGGSVYISSADLMTRNTERRAEAAVLLTGSVKDEVLRFFDDQLSDTAKARIRLNDGSYVRILPEDGASPYDSQQAHLSESRTGTDFRKTPETAGIPAVSVSAEIAPADKTSPAEKNFFGFFSHIAGFFRRLIRRR